MPTLAVIVPTYRRPDDLAELLRHLQPQIEGNALRTLIVVNDGAHDDAYAAVVRPHLTWMRYLPAPQNQGPGGARNAGAQLATADYLVFTDDDCRPPSGWLDRLEARFSAEPWLDGLAGATRPFEPNRKKLSERLITAARVLPAPTHDETGRLVCAVGAALAIRRTLFERVGGFDQAFRHAGEDLDLTQRLLKAGAIIEADEDWWTGHTTSDTLHAYLKRYHAYGKASARYAHVRRDWLHPDLRNYGDDDAAKRTVDGWARWARTAPLAEGAGRFDRWALRWFVWRVANCYAAGFAEGCEEFEVEAPPVEPWLRWPRLGFAADGLPRR